MTNMIPTLHIPRHPLWLMAYERAWQLLRRTLNNAAAPSEFDGCMVAMFARYAHDTDLLAAWLDHFYRTSSPQPSPNFGAGQKERAVPSPLLAWVEWELYHSTANASRLTYVLPQLIERYEWSKAQQRRGSGLYENDVAASGSHNSARDAHEWVDTTAQQALSAECIAHIAHALNADETAQRFHDEWNSLCELINERCWDEREQFYFDRRADGSLSTVKTVAGLWPLLAGASSAAQAKALLTHLLNPHEFWRVHVFPSLSADHPRYADRGAAWRGSVWPTANYAIIKGLERYGLHELAFRAADNHITTISHVFKETRSLWENYAPDYIEPGSIARPDELVAGLGPIALLIETVLGLHVDAPAHTLHWRPRLHETYAVKQLCCGRIKIDINVTEDHRAQITTSAPLSLHLITPASEQWIELKDEAVISTQ